MASDSVLRSICRDAATVAVVVAMLPLWALAWLLADDDRPEGTDTFEPDVAEKDDVITSFEASEEDVIDYRPGTSTLEDAAAETNEYNVYTERRVEIDPDRLAEWVRANYDDETRVHIQTKHGTDVYTRGERIDHECPVCGDSALVISRGGQRHWEHTDRAETCTLEEVADSGE